MKSLAYAVTTPALPGVGVTKASGYAVVVSYPQGATVTKAIAYAVTYPTATILQPGTAALAIAGQAPLLKFQIMPRPGTRALHISTFAPTVSTTGNYKALPGSRHLSLTGYPPLVYISQPAVPPLNSIYGPGPTKGAGDIYRLDQFPDGGSDIYRQPSAGGSIFKKP